MIRKYGKKFHSMSELRRAAFHKDREKNVFVCHGCNKPVKEEEAFWISPIRSHKLDDELDETAAVPWHADCAPDCW